MQADPRSFALSFDYSNPVRATTSQGWLVQGGRDLGIFRLLTQRLGLGDAGLTSMNLAFSCGRRQRWNQ